MNSHIEDLRKKLNEHNWEVSEGWRETSWIYQYIG